MANMAPSNVVDRIGERIEALPAWLRPVFYVPFILTAMIGAKLLILGIPASILLLIAALRGEVSFGDVGVGIQVLGVAYLGSALSGLTYGVVGRHLLRVPLVGRYVCGILCILPYMVAVRSIVAKEEHETFLASWDTGDYIMIGLLSALFGAVVGHTWFEDPKQRDSPSRAA